MKFTAAEKMYNLQDIKIVRILTDVLDGLNIVYAIGGSMASSVYGAVRFTQDADITVEPFEKIADRFYSMIEKDFYISQTAMRNALRNRTSFNVIHLDTAF